MLEAEARRPTRRAPPVRFSERRSPLATTRDIAGGRVRDYTRFALDRGRGDASLLARGVSSRIMKIKKKKKDGEKLRRKGSLSREADRSEFAKSNYLTVGEL